MIKKEDHVEWAAEAVAAFQKHCGTGDEHAIADLICDLGHGALGSIRTIRAVRHGMANGRAS